MENIEFQQFTLKSDLNEAKNKSYFIDLNVIFSNFSSNNFYKIKKNKHTFSKIKCLNILVERRESRSIKGFQNMMDNFIENLLDKKMISDYQNKENIIEFDIYFITKNSVKFLTLKKINCFYAIINCSSNQNSLINSFKNSIKDTEYEKNDHLLIENKNLKGNSSIIVEEIKEGKLDSQFPNFKNVEIKHLKNNENLKNNLFYYENELCKRGSIEGNSIKIFDDSFDYKNPFTSIFALDIYKYKQNNELKIMALLKILYIKELLSNFFKEKNFVFSYDFLNDINNNSSIKFINFFQELKNNIGYEIKEANSFVLNNNSFNYYKILKDRFSILEFVAKNEFQYFNKINSFSNNFQISNDYTHNYLNFEGENSLCRINNHKFIFENIISNNWIYKDKNENNYINNENSYLSIKEAQKSIIELEEETLSNEEDNLKTNIIFIQNVLKEIYYDGIKNFQFFEKNDDFVTNNIAKYSFTSIKNNLILLKIISRDKDLSFAIANKLINNFYQHALKLSEKIKEFYSNDIKIKNNQINSNNYNLDMQFVNGIYDFLDLLKASNYMENKKEILNYNKYFLYTSKPEYFLKHQKINKLNFITFNKIEVVSDFCIKLENKEPINLKCLDYIKNIIYSDKWDVEKIFENIKGLLEAKEKNIFIEGDFEIFNFKVLECLAKIKKNFLNKKIDLKHPLVKQKFFCNIFYLVNKSNNLIKNENLNDNIYKRINFLYEINYKLKHISNNKYFFIYIFTELIRKNQINYLGSDKVYDNESKKNWSFEKINGFLNAYFTNPEKSEFLLKLKEIILEYYLKAIANYLKSNVNTIENTSEENHLVQYFFKNEKNLDSKEHGFIEEEIQFKNMKMKNLINLNIEEQFKNNKDLNQINPLKSIDRKKIEIINIENLLFEIFNRKLPYTFFNIFFKVNFLKKFFSNIYANNYHSAFFELKAKYDDENYKKIIKFCFFVIVNIILDQNINFNEKKAYSCLSQNINFFNLKNFILIDLNDDHNDIFICDLINVIENSFEFESFLGSYFSEFNYEKIPYFKFSCSQTQAYLFVISKLCKISDFLSRFKTNYQYPKNDKITNKIIDFKNNTQKEFFKIIFNLIIFNNTNFQINRNYFEKYNVLNESYFLLNNRIHNQQTSLNFFSKQIGYDEKVKIFFFVFKFLKENIIISEIENDLNLVNSLNLNKYTYEEINIKNKNSENFTKNSLKLILNLLAEIIKNKKFISSWFQISLFTSLSFTKSKFSMTFKNFYFEKVLDYISSEFSRNLLIFKSSLSNKVRKIHKEMNHQKNLLENLFFIGFTNFDSLDLNFDNKNKTNKTNKNNIKTDNYHEQNEKEILNNKNEYLLCPDLLENFFIRNGFFMINLFENFLKLLKTCNFDIYNSHQIPIKKLKLYNLFIIFKHNTKVLFCENLFFINTEYNKNIITNKNSFNCGENFINDIFQLCNNIICFIFIIISKNKDKDNILDLLSNTDKYKLFCQNPKDKIIYEFLKKLSLIFYNIFSFFIGLRLFLLTIKLTYLTAYKNQIKREENELLKMNNMYSSLKIKIDKELQETKLQILKISIFNFFESFLINPEKEPLFLDSILENIETLLEIGNFDNDIIEIFFLFLNIKNKISILSNEKIEKNILADKYYNRILKIKDLIKTKTPIYFEKMNKKSECLQKLLEERMLKKLNLQITLEKFHFILINNFQEYHSFYEKLVELLFLKEKKKISSIINKPNFQTLEKEKNFIFDIKNSKNDGNSMEDKIKLFKKNIKKEIGELSIKIEHIFGLSAYFNNYKKKLKDNNLNIAKEKKNYILNILSKHFNLKDIRLKSHKGTDNKNDYNIKDFLNKHIEFSNDLNCLSDNLFTKIKGRNESGYQENTIEKIANKNIKIDSKKDEISKLTLLETNNNINERNKEEKINLEQLIENMNEYIKIDISKNSQNIHNDIKNNSSKTLYNPIEFNNDSEINNSSFFRYLKPQVKTKNSLQFENPSKEIKTETSLNGNFNKNKSNKEISFKPLEAEKIIKKKYIGIKIKIYYIEKKLLRFQFKKIFSFYLSLKRTGGSDKIKTRNLVKSNIKNKDYNFSKLEKTENYHSEYKNLYKSNNPSNRDVYNNGEKINNKKVFFSKEKNKYNLINSSDFNSNKTSSVIYDSDIKLNSICNTINMAIYNNSNKNLDGIKNKNSLIVNDMLTDYEGKLNNNINKSKTNKGKYNLIGKSVYPKLINNLQKFE